MKSRGSPFRLRIWPANNIVPLSGQDHADWNRIRQSIAELVQSAEREKGFSGVVLVRCGDGEVSVLTAGKQNADEDNTAETLFEIGSCTKPVTAVCCLRLQQQGKLSLDDPINQYLTDVPDHCAAITIRHLLQHTSGIPGTSYGVSTDDSAAFVRACLSDGPQHPPGSRFEYWNQGYALLAAIIEQTSGKTYMEAVKELIFDPAGMSEACFTGDGERTRASIGKSTTGPARSAMEPPYDGFYGFQYKGMGGAVMTASDLERFVAAIGEPDFLSKELASEMIAIDGLKYGLGWFVSPAGPGQKRVHHGGSVRCFLAGVSWYPGRPCRLVVLCNDDNRAVFSELEEAVRLLLESGFVAAVFDSELVEAISGDFTGQLPNGRSLVISISGDTRSLNAAIEWGGGLEPGEKDQFWLVDGSPEKAEIKLEWSADGKKIEALHFLNARFPRK